MTDKKPYGYYPAQIERYLQDFGPTTPTELAQAFGTEVRTISSILCRMKTETAQCRKRVYIADWVYDLEGARRYPRPRFALGNAPDAQRPKASPRLNKQRWAENKRARLTQNFVFNLALRPNVYHKANHEH